MEKLLNKCVIKMHINILIGMQKGLFFNISQ